MHLEQFYQKNRHCFKLVHRFELEYNVLTQKSNNSRVNPSANNSAPTHLCGIPSSIRCVQGEDATTTSHRVDQKSNPQYNNLMYSFFNRLLVFGSLIILYNMLLSLYNDCVNRT